MRLAFASAALLLAGIGWQLHRPPTQPGSSGLPAPPPVAVETLQIERVPLRQRIELSGVLEARHSIDLFTEVGGSVVEIGAEAPDRVEAGQLLVRFDARLATAAVRRAEASVELCRSRLGQATDALGRRRTLANRDIASAVALAQAEHEERIASAELRSAEASLDEARTRLGLMVLRAPFAGALPSLEARVGEYVHPGQRIGELIDSSTLRLELAVSDREIASLAPGDPARVFVEAVPGEEFSSVVDRTGPAVDPETKMFPLYVDIANDEERLLPGMLATAVLELRERRPAALVPREAVLERDARHFVYRVTADDEGDLVARQRTVEIRELPFAPTRLEIVAGLAPGDEIAITNLRALRDDVPVRRRVERRQDDPRSPRSAHTRVTASIPER